MIMGFERAMTKRMCAITWDCVFYIGGGHILLIFDICDG